MILLSLIALLACVSPSCIAEPSSPAFVISPPEWKYGMVTKGEVTRTRIVIANRGERPLRVELVPTCSCLVVSPASASIAAGSSASFELGFDTKDDEGKVSRAFIVKTEPESPKPVYYVLSGVVRADNGAAAAKAPTGAGATGQGSSNAVAATGRGAEAGGGLELRYYYTPGCRSCEAFISKKLPEMEAASGAAVRLLRRDLLDPKVYEEYAVQAKELGLDLKAIPALRIGDRLLQGDAEIESKLPGLLLAGRSDAPSSVPAGGAVTGGGISGVAASSVPEGLAVIPVMLAGLVDGINPCAFTTLIFLLASLALAGRGRREVLVIGALFSLGVFLTYLGIGFGLFAALRAASAVSIVSAVLRWLLVAVLLVFAALSVYDYFKIRAGKASEILLQLPNSLKLKIHASIRTRAKTAALAGSSLALGFLVSIFEFACTGQVYLPTLAYLARQKGSLDAIGLLVLYNLAFIAPLILVFAASYLGVSSKRIASAFQKRMGAVKLGLAAVFLALAVLTFLS